jgi:hypothetical protein
MKCITSLLILIAVSLSAYASPLAEIKSLSKQQQELLLGVLEEKGKADLQLIAAQASNISALESSVSTQKELINVRLNEQALRKYADEWMARSNWFEKDNVKQVEAKQKAISQTNRFRLIVWVALAIISCLVSTLVMKIGGWTIWTNPLVGLGIVVGSGFITFGALAGLVEIFSRG